jgi:hypothetical protein
MLCRGVVKPTSNRAVRVWIAKRMAAKHGNALRAFSSCLAIVRRGYFTGFAYEGWLKP